MTAPTATPWLLRCPVCSTPVPGALHPSTPCARCGLPAVGHAGMVVSRIGVTLADLQRDRDALLTTLRAAARPAAAPDRLHPTAPTHPSGTPAPGPHPAPRQTVAGPAATAHAGIRPPVAAAPPRPPSPTAGPAPTGPGTGTGPEPDRQPAWSAPVLPAPRRRVSPQEVLIGLGSLLVVAAALALVAVAWTRFGLGFQAGVMAIATTAAAVASGWAARRGLRATEEGLAVTASALLVIDVLAARALGLLGLDTVDGRLYGAAAAALVAVLTAALAARTRSTLVWPAVALFAAQPVLLLALGDLVDGVLGVVALLVVGLADASVAARLPRWAGEVARVLAGVAAGTAAVRGIALAWTDPPTTGAAATAVLVAASAAAVVLVVRRAGAGRPVQVPAPVALLAAVPALAVAGLTQEAGAVAAPLLAHVGLLLVTGAMLTRARRLWCELLLGAGTVLVVVGTGQLVLADRPAALAVVALAATGPAALTAWLVGRARVPGTVVALLLPGLALLAAREGGVFAPAATGLLLALLAASALALATLRLGRPEEPAAALVAPVLGLTAAATGGSVGAWGQLGVQLAIVGAAGLAYALVSRRTLVGWCALADLVLAAWISLAGATVVTTEAYSLPLAVALLAAAGPRLLRAPSWQGWGPALLVGFAPSVVTALGTDEPLRVLLVVGAGVVAVVAGVLTHRQAPFVVGAVAVGVLGAVQVAPLVSRLDSWVPLGAAGLLLLLVGASYERRRQQAREAVAWVSQMG